MTRGAAVHRPRKSSHSTPPGSAATVGREGVHGAVVHSISALLDLAVGRRCLGCDGVGPPWCEPCLRGAVDVHYRATPGSAVVAAGARYRSDVRAAIIGYKEHGQLALATPLGRLLAAALIAEAGPPVGAALIPIPSTRSATRARGQDHAHRLARRAAAVAGLSAKAALRWSRPVSDQSGLSVLDRRTNVAGAMVARPPLLAGSAAVLVDDVMTTGATLDEGRRALAVAGYRVVRVCVVAAVDTQRALAPSDRLR